MLRPYAQTQHAPTSSQVVRSAYPFVQIRRDQTRQRNARRAGAPVWHRNYYEHIIRSEKSLEAIRRYIENNPANWMQDEENPSNFTRKP